MKKKAVCMLLGVLLTGTLLTGCGKNKATEAASESAQTEKEGSGERQLILQRMTRRRLMKQRIRKQIKKQRRVQTLRKQERMLLKQKKTEKRLQYFFQMNRTGREMQKNWKYSLKKTDMIRFFFMQIMTAPNRCLRSSRWQPKRYLPW